MQQGKTISSKRKKQRQYELHKAAQDTLCLQKDTAGAQRATKRTAHGIKGRFLFSLNLHICGAVKDKRPMNNTFLLEHMEAQRGNKKHEKNFKMPWLQIHFIHIKKMPKWSNTLHSKGSSTSFTSRSKQYLDHDIIRQRKQRSAHQHHTIMVKLSMVEL